MSQTIRVAVTGAAGQVAYSILPRLASGEVFGANTKVILQLLEITPALQALEGVAMELEDCGFPTLAGIEFTDDPNKAFAGCNYALLVGAAPRKQGMERKDLLGMNGKIFVGQGQALAKNAASDVRILIVGNPCNTNCLVAYRNGKDIPLERWSAMTRLDHNRAVAAGQESRRAQRSRDVRHDLGKSLQYAISRFYQRQDSGQTRDGGDYRPRLAGRHLCAPMSKSRGCDHCQTGTEFRLLCGQWGHRSRQGAFSHQPRQTTGRVRRSYRTVNMACRKGWYSAIPVAVTAKETGPLSRV